MISILLVDVDPLPTQNSKARFGLNASIADCEYRIKQDQDCRLTEFTVKLLPVHTNQQSLHNNI
jgi:hypothetical protein